MSKRFLLGLACALLLTGFGLAQEPLTAQGAASDATNLKIHKLDLLIKLVPLVLKKSQFEQLLAAMDKARAIAREEAEKEDKALADLDPTITTTLDNAIQKGIYPPRDVQDQIARSIASFDVPQLKARAAMIKIISDAVTTVLNDGQIKTMEGSYSDRYINPANPASVTDPIKLDFYIRNVLLDSLSYDLLTEMSKHAS